MSEKAGEMRRVPISDVSDADANELARLRELLIQSGKLAELGTHVASLVHEMNQPLVAIKAFAQMLKGSVDDPASQRRATFIEEQAETLEKLVGRIRRYARHGQPVDAEVRSDLVPVVVVVLDLVDHHLRRTGVVLELDLPEGPLMVPLDSVRVQQLLVNLLTNAADAVEGLENRRVRLCAGTRADEVWIRVADTGAGIPPELSERILEPFFTTKDAERGTGLGLPICQEIAASCGGRLHVGSAPGAELPEPFVTAVEIILPAVAGTHTSPALEEEVK
jgi:two-component system, NtrC family, C4-dicarboxylate transport sensor histidine kinase DctB